ncbi:unnamed protein product [Rangifer tarandus platyrhynchus]|uniref:Uncharacterized protein n=1 Tax=Rangifer tarandus platyrhynchus TaxID=3082113 RepID=A0ABN8XJ37_RANTA|nr:unnamed protein product [Rangifer tarandus platyrhynchus]
MPEQGTTKALHCTSLPANYNLMRRPWRLAVSCSELAPPRGGSSTYALKLCNLKTHLRHFRCRRICNSGSGVHPTLQQRGEGRSRARKVDAGFIPCFARSQDSSFMERAQRDCRAGSKRVRGAALQLVDLRSTLSCSGRENRLHVHDYVSLATVPLRQIILCCVYLCILQPDVEHPEGTDDSLIQSPVTLLSLSRVERSEARYLCITFRKRVPVPVLHLTSSAALRETPFFCERRAARCVALLIGAAVKIRSIRMVNMHGTLARHRREPLDRHRLPAATLSASFTRPDTAVLRRKPADNGSVRLLVLSDVELLFVGRQRRIFEARGMRFTKGWASLTMRTTNSSCPLAPYTLPTSWLLH